MSKSYDPKYKKKPKTSKTSKPSKKPKTVALKALVSLDVFSFANLNKAYKKTRKGKRNQDECIEFTLELNQNLLKLEEEIKNRTYKIEDYKTFEVTDPKKRTINALHFKDRVVQHVLCDEILAPLFEPKLIYDNAACRKGKGTLFALQRQTKFFSDYVKENGLNGYILKYDIRKYFDNIDHKILKEKLRTVIKDEGVLWLLDLIIDSYETSPGKGLPLGNQTSQWFAVFYLDHMDKLIKANIKAYSRYMDDGILICDSKIKLNQIRRVMEDEVKKLSIEFNPKTQIFPIKNGVEYLGFRFSLNPTGKVIRKVKKATKKRIKKRLEEQLKAGKITDVKATCDSYSAHLKHGHAKSLRKQIRKENFIKKEKVLVLSIFFYFK